ncbi:glycosyltransferase [Vibrio metschnikovii]|nr:glycosyltransferase [Vibrio metschnikovii]
MSISLPKISIITVCYNAEKNIKKTLDSILSLNYENIEVIIVDGVSRDRTLEVVNKYIPMLPIKIICEQDKGIYDAMNKGIALSTGDWVIFMNSGDRFYNEKVLISIFSKEINEDVVAGSYFLEKNGRVYSPCSDLQSVKFGYILTCHQAMFFNKERLGGNIYYDLRYKVSSDNDMMMRLVKNKFKINFSDIVVCSFEDGGVSSTNSRQGSIDKYTAILRNFGLFFLIKAFLRNKFGILG